MNSAKVDAHWSDIALHVAGQGKWRRRAHPISVQDAKNARREASYVAKRNGVKEPLLEIWRVM